MNLLKISTPPHMNSHQTTQSIMRDVVIALLPASIVAVLFFGVGALTTILTSVAGCVTTEYLINKYLLKNQSASTSFSNSPSSTADLSAVITGILLAFNLPSNFPIWMNLLGCFMAIGVAKMAFGGLGRNIFNPALIGRVFLFISFPKAMSSWPVPQISNFMNTDVQTAATTLSAIKHGSLNFPSYWQLLVGYMGGCIGEVSVIALLIGFAYLLFRRVVSWSIPFYMLATVFIFTSIFWYISGGDIRYDPVVHLLSGGLMLGALFMATDYTTSPMTPNGKIIFAIGCGLLTSIIRLFGPYPEGVSFAILIMNAFVPIIDKLTMPRVFGKGRIKTK